MTIGSETQRQEPVTICKSCPSLRWFSTPPLSSNSSRVSPLSPSSSFALSCVLPRPPLSCLLQDSRMVFAEGQRQAQAWARGSLPRSFAFASCITSRNMFEIKQYIRRRACLPRCTSSAASTSPSKRASASSSRGPSRIFLHKSKTLIFSQEEEQHHVPD